MEKFREDQWKKAVGYARLGQTEPMLVRFSAEPAESNKLCYGHIKASRLKTADEDLRKVYADARVLVLLPVKGPLEIMRCPSELRDAILAAEEGKRQATDEFMANLDKTPAFPTKSAKPVPIELWWQKEQRIAAERWAVVVSLRNDVRSLLGM